MENYSITNNCIICGDKFAGKVFIKTDELSFLKCPECSLIWRIHPKEDLTEYDDKEYFSRFYEDKRKRRVQKSKQQIKLIEKFKPAKGTLLEIGCSMGYFLQAAKEEGWQATGIDIGSYAIDHCKNLGLEAYHMSASELEKLGKTYDVIVMRHVFEHLPNPVEQLQLFLKLLKPEGLLMINLPNGRYIKGRIFKEKYKFYSPKSVGLQHYFYYSPFNLKVLLEQNNYKVLMENDLIHSALDKVRLSKEFTSIAQRI